MSSTDLGGEFNESRRPEGSGSSPADLAKDAARAVKQETASFAADTREKAVEKIDEKKEAASQMLGDFASAIRKAGDDLAQNDQSMATHLVRQAADGLENFARSLADKRPEQMLDAVRDFGRRNPTAFVAGSVLAGVALGRLLRSSSSHDTSSAKASSTNFTAPGGAPAYPLTDAQAVGATVLGAEHTASPDDVEMIEGMGPDATGETPDAMDAGPGRFGSRS